MNILHCDICGLEIVRGNAASRWLRVSHEALGVDVEVTGWKIDTPIVIDICLECARRIVAEGKETSVLTTLADTTE